MKLSLLERSFAPQVLIGNTISISIDKYVNKYVNAYECGENFLSKYEIRI
jgi:hypothetical protein